MKSYDIEPLVVSAETENITDLLEARAAKTPSLPLFSIEQAPGRWVQLSAKDFHSRVVALAKGLVAAGIQPGQAVAIMSRTRFEWTLIDFAIWYAGAVSVPIYESSAPSQMEWILSDSDSVALFLENDEHVERFEQIKAGAPLVRKVWKIESDAIDQLIKVGREITDETIAAKRKTAKLRDLATIIYTSGTTGKPKGILHSTGGYLTQAAYTHKNVFDLHENTDVYWCTADIGWITGHSYVAYGPLANGASQVIYEGTPETPDWGRWWSIVQKYGVSILYTAPTAIRSFMKLGSQIPKQSDLSSIRVLGSVGEPINPEAWMWYRNVIGGGHAPIVDTWWQTETGAIMVSPLPGLTTLMPGSAQKAVPGVEIKILDDEGTELGLNHAGLLVIDEPWPSMLRGIWGDPERYKETYWDKFHGKYFAGDGAKFDDEGNVWLLGRVDDVMNVSGHRLSTAEIESALVSHPFVAEAAVVGAKDETTGQAVVAFVILRQNQLENAGSDADVSKILRDHVAKEIGPIAKPRQIMVVAELPKTRSGKIMRRLLRDVAEDRPIGDVTTLADTSVMDIISGKVAAGASD